MSEPESNEARLQTVRLWLYAVACLVFLMVIVGGATRLTDSGLSIVEWRPVTGAVPPLTESAWADEFGKYKATTEYELVNKDMSLPDFKRIYWWEWGHRFLGRLIGLAFVGPFLFFLARGWLDRALKRRLLLLLALGGLQGAIGWWMVASGLVGRVDVAQERLAVHLVMASLIIAVALWIAQGAHSAYARPSRPVVMWGAAALLALVLLQIGLGGLVAGLKAGLIYNTWPRMGEALVPSAGELFFLEPYWRNLLDNHTTVQLSHRLTAYALLTVALAHVLSTWRSGGRADVVGAAAVLILIVLQSVLGIYTLLLHLPFALALGHQALGMIVLVAATLHLHATARGLPVADAGEWQCQTVTA
jgi:cytochrome c oxidase assembly protein subunit 15